MPGVAVLLVTLASALIDPPQSGTWKTTAEEGKADATKRNVPMLVFVATNNEKSQWLKKALEDPAVARHLGHFSCIFLSPDYDVPKYQSSYVPWIAATPDTRWMPPTLVAATPKGPNAGLRRENVEMNVTQLIAHLDKILAELAPAEAQKLRMEGIEQAKFPELARKLDETLNQLGANLSEGGGAKFKEEIPWAVLAVKFGESKAGKEFKDKDAKKKATDLLADVKKQLAELQKFKGKDPDKFKQALTKARESAKALLELQP